jgi:tetratricopeptide (TPR) repeat protein
MAAVLTLCAAVALGQEQQLPAAADVVGDAPRTINAGVPELDFQEEGDPGLMSPDAASYQFYITDLENRFGPYAPGLSEQLLGLGVSYQNQGLHEQAIEVFKRGVHVSRVNNGLQSSEQIPLLQRMISSHVALGQFTEADERQYYLFRIQAENYGVQSPEMSAAMMERAEWERQAYYLSLGNASFVRLLTMWELYSNVLGNIARTEGHYSVNLLRPLDGLLQTQYMVTAYGGEPGTAFEAGNSADLRFIEQNRFSSIRASNYKQGQAVIAAIHDVYDYNEGDQSPLRAESMVMMGDWHQWHQKRESALTAYQAAWDALAELDDGEKYLQQYFAAPSLLPALSGWDGELPPPDVIKGYADVTYYIDERGRIKDLELVHMEPLDPEDKLEPVRLLRQLKQMQYRPRFENREPVATEVITKRYAY